MKVKVFFWLMAKNKIHIGANLMKKGWTVSQEYLFSGANEETVPHLFVRY